MVDYTFEQLKHMKVAQLREIASGIDHEAVKGYTQLRKEEIIHGICTALQIQEVVHHEVVGINKAAIKAKIKALKAERDAALRAHDTDHLKMVRRRIHHLKRNLHKATV
jgi:predicted nucleotide-binding protein